MTSETVTSTPKIPGSPDQLAAAIKFFATSTRKPGWKIIDEKYDVEYISYLISGAGLTTVEDALGFFQDVADEEPISLIPAAPLASA